MTVELRKVQLIFFHQGVQVLFHVSLSFNVSWVPFFHQAKRDDCIQKKRNVPQDIADEKDESLQV